MIDEAAIREAREAVYDALHERAGCSNDESCGGFWSDADAVLDALYEAGLLLVRDHTKET